MLRTRKFVRSAMRIARDFFDSVYNYVEQSRVHKESKRDKSKNSISPPINNINSFLQIPKKREYEEVMIENDPNAPKKPENAFNLYSNFRKKQANTTSEGVRKIEEEWGRMSQIDKSVWMEKAKKDKMRYLVETERYKENTKKLTTQNESKDPFAIFFE